MRDGSGRKVEGNQHPDPRVEAVRWSICEAELIQSIGRGRGVNRGADKPLQIDILTNVCLPIEVDNATTWNAIQPSLADIMRARGAVPLGYRDMAAAYFDLFPSPHAAEVALGRENPSQTPIERYLIGVCEGFLSIPYRRTGSRGPAARLLYDPTLIDPTVWLNTHIGEVQIIGDPAPVAAESAQRAEKNPGQTQNPGQPLNPGQSPGADAPAAHRDERQQSLVEIMRSSGAIPLNYRDMAAAYPDLFASPESARKALDRETPGQTPNRDFLLGICVGFLSLPYRRTGSRGLKTLLLFDPAKIDPAAWLAEKLGEVTILGDPEPVAAGRDTTATAKAKAEPVAAADPAKTEPAAEPVAAVDTKPDSPVPRSSPGQAVRRCTWLVDTTGDVIRKCGEPIVDGRDWCPVHRAQHARTVAPPIAAAEWVPPIAEPAANWAGPRPRASTRSLPPRSSTR